MTDTDRIEKKILLQAPRARVWRALTDSAEFGSWFGMKFDAPFAPGAVVRGALARTPDSSLPEEYVGMPFELSVDEIVPESRFSFRWHPHAIERGKDYSAEPMTLVVFELEEVAGGVRLSVTESGFDQVPVARRARAFAANGEGWAIQMRRIEEHLGRAA